MIRIFLPATIGVILALGCLDARAMPASAPATMPFSGVNEMTHKGNYVVDFIEGKLVPSEPERAAPKAQSPETGREENYATSNVIMTLAFFAAFASTLAGFAAFGRFGRKEEIAETTTEDAWKESLLEMLEADLRNLDSMTHGFSSR
jgi:hypothetical protein